MISKNTTIDRILRNYQSDLASNFVTYRNHVYRVFNFACLLDARRETTEHYAIASAFHDLGIWTTKSFDYLAPSIELAKEYLRSTDRENEIEEIALMIDFHHKISPYHGVYSKTVESFRKADWIDLSLYSLRFGLEKKIIREIRTAFPNKGFHLFLLRETIKRFLKHPLRPLPMFRK